MFDILDRPLHWIPVKWPGLAQGDSEDALSKPTEHEIELRVELVDREEIQTLFPALFGKDTAPPTDMELFKRVVKGWRKIKANGRVPDFSDENIALLLKAPLFAPNFSTAYLDAMGGQTAIREGNSGGLPSGGQADAPNTATTTNSSGNADSSE